MSEFIFLKGRHINLFMIQLRVHVPCHNVLYYMSLYTCQYDHNYVYLGSQLNSNDSLLIMCNETMT